MRRGGSSNCDKTHWQLLTDALRFGFYTAGDKAPSSFDRMTAAEPAASQRL
jgi:hypothetical protein